jgi:hypothetical protein
MAATGKPTVEERVAELETAVAELLLGLRGIGGNGVVARSPAARAIALAWQERRRESDAAA